MTGVAQLSSWGGFLILVSFTVGTLYEKNEQRVKELKNAYIGVLEILSKYLESTDRYTKGHSVRVSELATEIAIAMGLPRSAVENIRVSGLLHDIGKIEISSEILSKAAELSKEEKELMDQHTVKGAYILTAVGSVLKEVVPIVVAHHQYFADTFENNVGDESYTVGSSCDRRSGCIRCDDNGPSLPQRHAALGGFSGDPSQNKQTI